MIICSSWDEQTYAIVVGNETIRFDWSHQFGPMPITKQRRERNLRHSHPFWRAVSLWNLQGRETKGCQAIWHEPKKPVLKHIGGRHYQIVDPGEIGHDW
jgi:hypothetical protein